jgi:hypothetical protein
VDELREASTQQTIDYLVRLGLGDVTKLIWYRKVFADPHGSVQNPMLRPYVADALSRLFTLATSDPQILNRLKVLLQRDFRNDGKTNTLSEAAMGNLEKKARQNGIPLQVLVEVYQEEGDTEPGKTPEQVSFERVNAYVATHGKPRLTADRINRALGR